MFSINRYLLPFLLMSLLVSPAFADELVSLKAGYQNLKPKGVFAISGNDLAGTQVDLEQDLKFEDSDDLTVEAALQLGSFRLFAAYLPVSFSGKGELDQPIRFKGETFVAGSRVDSKVDLDIYEAGITWYLLNFDDLPARFQLGPEIAAKYIDARIAMRSLSTGLEEEESASVPLPTIGLRARVALADFLGVVGRVGYLKYNDDRYFDVDAQVELSPIPLVGLYAGYRYLDLDLDESNLFVDASLDGPYVGALVRF